MIGLREERGPELGQTETRLESQSRYPAHSHESLSFYAPDQSGAQPSIDLN